MWQAGATLHHGAQASHCRGLSLLRSTSSRRTGSAVVAHGPSCSTACGIFPDQGSNPCPLHWQADSQPLRHQGSPVAALLTSNASPVSCVCTLLMIARFDIIFVFGCFPTFSLCLPLPVSFSIHNFLVSSCGLFLFFSFFPHLEKFL